MAGPRAASSLAVTLRPHLCSQGPHLSLLPSLKGSGIQKELEELVPAVGPQAHPIVAMTTMPASIFFKPLSPALPLSLSSPQSTCPDPLGACPLSSWLPSHLCNTSSHKTSGLSWTRCFPFPGNMSLSAFFRTCCVSVFCLLLLPPQLECRP